MTFVVRSSSVTELNQYETAFVEMGSGVVEMGSGVVEMGSGVIEMESG